MSNVEVTPLGIEAAVISYSVGARRPPFEEECEEPPFWALISSIWRIDPESKQWQLCFQQQIPIEEDWRMSNEQVRDTAADVSNASRRQASVWKLNLELLPWQCLWWFPIS
jgi:hypothetical protein